MRAAVHPSLVDPVHSKQVNPSRLNFQSLISDPIRLHECNGEIMPVFYCFLHAAVTLSNRRTMLVSIIKSSAMDSNKCIRANNTEHDKEMCKIF